ncbi:hypothetical protein IWQ60_000051 [Tieghemiomyces parasiticus]|uniref:Uncharacterized protein n=1 Tax=Tieghemiomyces parasiticus TaxID=78921 RepID=A0A9W8AJR2_9FUNG|nr:hypothetical protein IWQ60_000051 [Tieghemiomyces parasiticus]
MRKTRSSDRTHTPHSTASDILGDAAEDATTDHIHRREEMAEKKLRNRDLEIAAHNLYRKQVLKDRLNYLSLNHLLPPTPASQSPPAYSRPAPEAVSENDQPLPGHGDNEATPPVERPNLRRPRRTPSSGSASTTIHAHSRRPTFRGSLLPLNVNMTKEEFRLPSTWLRKRK